MSLLLDALRKAEEQKRKMGSGAAATQGPQAASSFPDLTLEPLDTAKSPEPAEPFAAPATRQLEPLEPPASQATLPELPQRLEDLDAQFLEHAAQPAPKPRPQVAAPPMPPAPEPIPSSGPSQRGEPPRKTEPVVPGDVKARESVRQVFAAKETSPQAGNRRSFAIAVGGLTLVAALAIGGWFWWQLQPRGGLAAPPMVAAPPPSPSPMAAAPGPAPVAVPPAPTFTNDPEPVEDDEDVELIPPPPPARPAPPAPPPAASPESPIRVTAAMKSVDTTLDQAWEAFNRGEFDLARQAWQKALASDPRNRNALHGMAAVAMQRQRPEEAAEYYLRAAEADPKDALALAGLASLRAPVDILQTESRLKNLLAEQPESPYLYFALGNLYARAMRWAEAQQAFFRAHAADPVNPDYLFNLAVSLDQLRQPRLAAGYYQRALAAAAERPAGFDAVQASARLKALTGD